MKYLCTVADDNVINNLKRFVRSVVASGWKGDIVVFSHSNKLLKKLPKSCIGEYVYPWWDKYQGKHKKDVKNEVALAKPDIFMKFKKGDHVIYADCADILFLCNLDQIFKKCGDKPLYAREFKSSKSNYLKTIPEKAKKELKLKDVYFEKKSVANNGVIVGNIDKHLLDAMEIWKDILLYYQDNGPFYARNVKNKVGDQVPFNYMYRALNDKNLTGNLPMCYNFNGHKNMRKLKVKNNKLWYKDTEIFVPHYAGGFEIPDEVSELASS